MPDYIAAALLALGLVLPVAVAAIATAWEKESREGTPLLGRILVLLLFGGTVGYFAGIAAYGQSRYYSSSVEYGFYWIAGVIVIVIGICMLGNSYTEE